MEQRRCIKTCIEIYKKTREILIGHNSNILNFSKSLLNLIFCLVNYYNNCGSIFFKPVLVSGVQAYNVERKKTNVHL